MEMKKDVKMESQPNVKKTLKWLKRNAFLVGLFWTFIIAGLLGWNLRGHKKHLLESVTKYARSAYNKDVAYRRWVAFHGGVYVPSTVRTPPNPYLANIPHRDVATTDGMKLTLVNPAYMTRQVFALGRKQYGFRGHITSLKPLRPENRPDPWEKKALTAFEAGTGEVVEVSKLNGDRYLRLMRPLMVEKGCLKCHGEQGYKLGDIRGGVSVSINLEPILAAAHSHWWQISSIYGVIWLLGLLGIGFTFSRFGRHFKQLEVQKILLRQTRDHFKNFYQQAPVAFQSLGEDGTVLEVNDRWLDTLGYQIDEVTGKNFTVFLSQSSVKIFRQRFVQFKIVDHIEDVVLDLKHRDGRVVKGRYYGRVERDDQGNFRRTLCVFHDVTENIEKQETIIRLQRQNEIILMAAGEGIIGLDRERKPLFVNPAAAEILGYSPDELMGRDSHQTWCRSAEDGDLDGCNVCQICLAMGAKKEKVQIVDTLYRRDGSSFPAALTITPITGKGENIGGVVMFSDISERLKEQQQLTLLAALVEQTNSSIVIADRDLKITYVNPACERITGYDMVEMLGQKAPEYFSPDLENDEQRLKMMACIERGERWHGPLKTRIKNGTILEEDGVIFPIKDKMGKVLAYAGIRHDVSERRKLERQLAQARKMESIGQLAGGVAHDFNNILTVINGYAQILLMKLEKNSKLWRDAWEIEKAGERAAGLTRQLLAFSRKQVIMPTAIRLNDEISEMEKMLRRLIGEDIEMKMVLAEDLPLIYVDPSQLQQVMLNLVVNARDALNDKVLESEKRITISTSRKLLDEGYVALHPGSCQGWHVQIQVEDNGIGMSTEVTNQIFEPFFTTKGVGQGTGMGLATVYGIVKQNRASIYVYSEPGQGTVFKIYWPVMDDNLVLHKQEKDDLSTGGNEVILLAEDDKALREITSRQLRQVGYTIIGAANGKEALEKAASQEPGTIDLLFTDVVMPVMGGRKLAASIRDFHPGITILFASGYPDDRIRQDIVELGRDQFIDKPYAIKHLLRRIRSLLDNRQV